MSLARKLIMAGGVPLAVQDVFSTDVYTGNGTTQKITNGVNLLDAGGLVWAKSTNSGATHYWVDTERGPTKALRSSGTNPEQIINGFPDFYVDGFETGFASNQANSGQEYVAWTFRKKARFFDIVTYTGNGVSGRVVPHELGGVPGMIFVKRRDAANPWVVWHKDRIGSYLLLNTTEDEIFDSGGSRFSAGAGAPTSTDFMVGVSGDTNAVGSQYVAYLFAHDESPEGVIQCGSYIGNGTTPGPVINLGWTPQWLMIKNASQSNGTTNTVAATHWHIADTARLQMNGEGSDTGTLQANTNFAEGTAPYVENLENGFRVTISADGINDAGETHIYMAIRAEGM